MLKFVLNGNDVTADFSTTYVEIPLHVVPVASVALVGSLNSLTHNLASFSWNESTVSEEKYVQLGQYNPNEVYVSFAVFSNKSHLIGVAVPLACTSIPA